MIFIALEIFSRQSYMQTKQMMTKYNVCNFDCSFKYVYTAVVICDGFGDGTSFYHLKSIIGIIFLFTDIR